MNNTLETDSTSQSPAVFPKPLPTSIYIDLLLILLCVMAVFGRTLTSYFLADDFGEILYLHRICSGEFNLLLSNFTGNYMQIPGMSVYRPFLLMSLLIDFIVWKTNAAGFYATNLIFYFLDAALLYLIVLKLGCSKNNLRNRLTALTASVLFALSPLHCESVSWVLGRVDIVCAFFYLLSFYLLFHTIEKKSKKVTAFAIAAFISGLLVKEMAIGIPVIAFLVGWLYKRAPTEDAQPGSIKDGLLFACPYLAATAAYFVVRYLALGTLVGGYVAGFGASQEKNALSRWLDKDTLERIALPLVQGHFQASELISLSLLVLYAVLIAIFSIRVLAHQVPPRIFLFLAGWSVTTLLPIYKLWGIGYNLEGARFLFFFTMPLSTALAAGLFQYKDTNEEKQLNSSLFGVSAAVAISLCAIFAYLAAKTDLIWVNAGKEVRAAAQAARTILSTEKTAPAIFLNIPKESKGTHMILNGDTFRAVVMAPFAEENPKRKFAIFEPVMYSPEFEIDATRLKSLAGKGAETFVWSSQKRQFENIQYAGGNAIAPIVSPPSDWRNLKVGGHSGLFAPSNEGIVFQDGDGLQGIQLSELQLNPLSVDFAAINIKSNKSQMKNTIGASWTGKQLEHANYKETSMRTFIPQKGGTQFQTVYIPLSRHPQWFQTPTVETLFLSLPPGQGAVKSVELLQEKECCPQIVVEAESKNENGIHEVNEKQSLHLKVDSSALKGAQTIILQVGKANFFFDNFRETEGAEAVEKEIPISKPTAQYEFKRSDFSGPGYYQLRAKAMDGRGVAIAAPSRSITISVH